jgi:23S rRNA (cytosine1962-C5)-methyltransferase
MNLLTQTNTTNYQLIDSGNGHKLEQFGHTRIIRPDDQCIWSPRQNDNEWHKANAHFHKTTGWKINQAIKSPWLFTFHPPAINGKKQANIVTELRLSHSKNIGVFPEQSANWEWMSTIIGQQKNQPHVLNLFGYTGMASLVAAAAGAQVCHVDASQAALNWGKHNQKLSNLHDASIRWIVDDCAKFITREIKRGMFYNGIIMDPPAFGRDHKGKIFSFEKQIVHLLALCTQILPPKPLFFIFNGYAMGHSATVLKNLLQGNYPTAHIEFGELHVAERDGKRTVPCSLYARFTNHA